MTDGFYLGNPLSCAVPVYAATLMALLPEYDDTANACYERDAPVVATRNRPSRLIPFANSAWLDYDFENMGPAEWRRYHEERARERANRNALRPTRPAARLKLTGPYRRLARLELQEALREGRR